MDNRRLLIAVLLSLVILVGWHYLFPPAEPTRPPEPPPAAAPAERSAPPPAADTGAAVAEEVAVEAEAAVEAEEEAAPPVEAAAERRVVVETESFRAELTNRGAQIVSFVLREHARTDGGPLDLVRRREGGPYPFALVAADTTPLALNDALFAVEESGAEGARTVAFRYRGPAGAAAKTFLFRPDGLFDVTVEVEQPRQWALWLGPGIRNPTTEELENRFARRGGVYRLGGKFERIDPKKAEQPTVLPGTGLEWVGLDDHYFLTAAIPRAPIAGARFEPLLVEPGAEYWRFAPVPPEGLLSEAQKELERDFALLIEPAASDLALTGYWGAKKIQLLADMPYSLDDTIDLGWFGFFARYLFVGLEWIYHRVVSNYGWAIVLLTVVINLVLLPLTHKSYTSMQKMQQLNPKMQAIRERYRSKLKDAQGKPKIEVQRKMNEEIMALYKAEGVNPAGGCLPMLIQLPVLFAFYRLLSAAVELRGAPWMLWIHDLSAPDPYYALPLIMGATQFLQQRMTPMAGDPMQRRIFQLMPVFMTFLFLGFPSGMVLYWLTNNVLTIARQAIYLRFKKSEAEPAPKKAKKGRRKSGR